jgi:hypothetical protein
MVEKVIADGETPRVWPYPEGDAPHANHCELEQSGGGFQDPILTIAGNPKDVSPGKVRGCIDCNRPGLDEDLRRVSGCREMAVGGGGQR